MKKIRLGLIFLSLGLIIFGGLVEKEHMTVLIKAINICLECVGIG